jgi:lysophospholipase L1-like esterase
MLGPHWEVKTFAAGGRTLLRKQDPLDYRKALKYRPDVVVILLGTYDARQQTWDKHGKEFVSDYEGVIKDFRKLDTHPKIWVCLPVPAFPEHWGIDEKLISGTVIPAIREAATGAGVPIIDLHTPLQDKKAWFPDSIHPNQEGAKHIAETIKTVIARPEPAKQ